jgi:hypothetical protein
MLDNNPKAELATHHGGASGYALRGAAKAKMVHSVRGRLVGRRDAFTASWDVRIVQSANGNGPHSLTPQKIGEVVTKTSAGNYALGHVQENGFCVLYVGRSDVDVAKQLRYWAGQHTRYKAFVFVYAPNPRAAFDKECEDFHDLGGIERLDNAEHPKPPAKTDWLCPRCDFYG